MPASLAPRDQRAQRGEALIQFGGGHRVVAHRALGVKDARQLLPRGPRALLPLAQRGAGSGSGDEGIGVIAGRPVIPQVVVILVIEPVGIGILITVEIAEPQIAVVLLLGTLALGGEPQRLIARTAQIGIAGNVLVNVGGAQGIGIGPADRARVVGFVDPEAVPGKAAAAHSGAITAESGRRSRRSAAPTPHAHRR